MTNDPQVTTDLLMLGESYANVSDLRGEAACEVIETKSLEMTRDLVEDADGDEDGVTVEPRRELESACEDVA